MAIREIVNKNDDILRKKSRTVEIFDKRLSILLDDMAETLKAANGAGLAAVQVGILRRICIVSIDEEEGIIELINPVIKEKRGEQVTLEGCLSCPNEFGYTKRPAYVKVEALNRKGKKIVIEGEGLKAKALCHEIDHLDGILFIDHAKMVDPSEYESDEEK